MDPSTNKSPSSLGGGFFPSHSFHSHQQATPSTHQLASAAQDPSSQPSGNQLLQVQQLQQQQQRRRRQQLQPFVPVDPQLLAQFQVPGGDRGPLPNGEPSGQYSAHPGASFGFNHSNSQVPDTSYQQQQPHEQKQPQSYVLDVLGGAGAGTGSGRGGGTSSGNPLSPPALRAPAPDISNPEAPTDSDPVLPAGIQPFHQFTPSPNGHSNIPGFQSSGASDVASAGTPSRTPSTGSLHGSNRTNRNIATKNSNDTTPKGTSSSIHRALPNLSSHLGANTAMRSTRGRPNKVTKPSQQQHQVAGIQRRQSRQSLAHDPAAAAALAAVASVHGSQAGDRPDAIMNEVDAEADDDSPMVPGDQQDRSAFSAETGAAAAIAAMSEQLQGPDMSGVNVTSPDLQIHHYTGPPHNPHHNPAGGSQYPMPPQSQPQETMGKTTEQVARDLGYNFVVDSTMGKRLAREPGMRMAIQRRSEQVLNLQRRSNVEALFAHIAGEVAPSPCKNCHKGHGPWSVCVVVDGQMCGSCANCWFNASGARCSFHEARNPQPHAHPAPPLLTGESSLGFPPMTPSTGGVPALQNIPAGMFTPDSIARYHLDKALGEVRPADRRARQMMLIETTAKQLALQIAEYEDIMRDEQHQQAESQQGHQHQHQHQQSQQVHGATMSQQAPPVMMDDQGA